MMIASAWPMISIITDATLAVGAYDVLPYNTFSSKVESKTCEVLDGIICSAALKWFLDGDPKIDNKARYPVFMSNIPSGAGYREFVHYAQLMHSDGFKRYDYGANENVVKYGQATPPDYKLDQINFPLGIFGGSKDVLADPKDVAWFHSQVQDHTYFYKGDYDLDHNSFASAINMDFFTKDAMAVINHFNNKCDESTFDSNFVEGNMKCQD